MKFLFRSLGEEKAAAAAEKAAAAAAASAASKTVGSQQSSAQIKAQMEQQLKQQRLALAQKRIAENQGIRISSGATTGRTCSCIGAALGLRFL